MHKERLTKLAELMDGLKPEQFDIGDWVSLYKGGEADCGTVACACGWAAITPWFKQQGLSLDGGTPTFDGWHGLSAAAEFFGLDRYDAERLFLGFGYDSEPVEPSDVALAIRTLIEENE